MEFKILNKAINPSYLNAFVVVVEQMHGDMDYFDKTEIGGFKRGQDEHLLISLIETCERLKNAYPNGRNESDTYDHIEGFQRWFDIDNFPSDEYKKLSEKERELTGEWYYNEYGSQASFYDYNVFYYDEHGIKYNVEIKK